MRHVFRLSDAGSPEIAVDQSQLVGLRVAVDGQPLQRLREGGRPAWQIPLADGSRVRVRFGGQLTGLQAILDDGTVIQIERRLRLWELVLAVLPFGLFGVTGVAGGVFGLVAVLVDLRLLRMAWSGPVRILACLTALAVALVASIPLAPLFA
jgi:hypothetical protein